LTLLLALADVDRDARTLNVARALARAGRHVHVIAAGTLRDEDAAPTAAGGSITLHSWPDPGGSAFARWRSFTAFALRRLPIQATTIGAMDLFALYAARQWKQRCRAKLIYDAREFYFALGPLQGRGLKQRLISGMERLLIRSADTVTVSGEMDAEIIRDRYRLATLPTVILNVPPYREPVPSRKLREACNIPIDAKVLLYQGVVHHGRGIGPMIATLPLLPRMHLCVIGDGPARIELATAAQAAGVADRVHWLGAISYDDLHAWTCSADVGLCIIEPISKSYEYALPNKLFEYIMAQVPVVTTDLPAMRRIIQRYGLGVAITVPPEPEAIARAIERALDRNHFIPLLRAAAKLFSYERQEETVLCTY
jgi:glycosyltransferase involved in cell wall biosynthesis